MSNLLSNDPIDYYYYLRMKHNMSIIDILRPQSIFICSLEPNEIIAAKSFRRQIVELAWDEMLNTHERIMPCYRDWYLNSLKACD